MQYFDEIIFWLSGGLMIPVMIGIFYFLVRGLLSLGKFYGQYFNRLKYRQSLQAALSEPDRELASLRSIDHSSGTLLGDAIRDLLARQNSAVYRDKIVADFEVACEKELDKNRTLAKMGPILGLMGTLIPMGPALAGLSAGDISSMSQQMQIAFNTTVLGLVIGCIGYLLLQTRQRWYAEDLNQLEFIYDLMEENTPKQ